MSTNVNKLKALLHESAALFRRYESSHRARGPAHLVKADCNADIASRIEKALEEPKPQYQNDNCPGIEIMSGRFSGCDQSGGDCPTCGK